MQGVTGLAQLLLVDTHELVAVLLGPDRIDVAHRHHPDIAVQALVEAVLDVPLAHAADADAGDADRVARRVLTQDAGRNDPRGRHRGRGGGPEETSAGDVLAQGIGGFTRHLEPVDTLIGIAFNKDMAPKNVKDGNAFVGKAFTYMETTIELFSGKPIADVSKSSAEGDRKQQTTKNLGTRNVQLTNTLRVMNMLGYESWDNNASFKVSKLAAEAGNEYNGAFFNRIDKVAERMMSSEIFRNSPIKAQRKLWEEELEVVRDRARADLSTNYAGEQSTLSSQYELTERNTIGALKTALYDLGYDGKTIGDLDQAELDIVKTYIETQALNEELALPRGSY